MTKRSESGQPAWEEPARMQLRQYTMLSAPKLITMRMIACCVGLISVSMGFAPFAAAQDIGSVIALPDLPFVIPIKDPNYTFPSYKSQYVLTQRNDNNRSGASFVPGLNQNTVTDGHFRYLGELPVRGVVTAQPLYSQSSKVGGVQQPVLIVATSNNDVYAFRPSEFAKDPLWHVGAGQAEQLAPPMMGGEGACLSSVQDPNTLKDGQPNGVVGIESTPVIDVVNNQVLVSYKNHEGVQRLAALDLNDGHIKKKVSVPSPNPDWHKLHRNRASLLLADGVVYLAFSGLCELRNERFHGSISAFDARTLDSVGHFQVTDDETDGGGIWQGSTGLAADSRGNLYFATGNRRLGKDKEAPDWPNYSNSVIRLKTEKIPSRNPGEPYTLRMSVEDYFTPYRKIFEDLYDLDLASSGVLLIPGTHYLAAGGKEGIIYVLDRADFGHYDNGGPSWNYKSVKAMRDKKYNEALDDKQRDNVFQKFQAGENQYEDDEFKISAWERYPHIHGTPVFARFGNDQAFMFVWAEKDWLKQYHWHDDGEGFDRVPLKGDQRAPNYLFSDGRNGMPGGMLSVNIDPSGSGLGVVFASVKNCDEKDYPACSDSQDRGILRAYNPFNMQKIWANDGENYWFAKFVPPTVANGRVFLATASGKVLIYGLPPL
jgi:hypothetical protein